MLLPGRVVNSPRRVKLAHAAAPAAECAIVGVCPADYHNTMPELFAPTKGGRAGQRPTIGVLSTWAIYEGTSLDWYAHTLLRGMRAAARDHGCDLLLGCGIGLPSGPRESRTAWAITGTGINFIPVGAWNADGLIIIPDNLSDVQSAYVQDLIRAGYPVIATTAEQPWPLVAIDNAGGIRLALDHLLEHGHRNIAFVAGNTGGGGDSVERLRAYKEGLHAAGIPLDPRLVAYGDLCYSGGVEAMRSILAAGVPFSAVLASNDQSCLGALAVLRSAGLRVPEDVAVIGFDDSQEARTHIPPITSVRHPAYRLGYRAVQALCAIMVGQPDPALQARIPTRLIVRQSCGCQPASANTLTLPAAPAEPETHATLARAMADAIMAEVRGRAAETIEARCRTLVAAAADLLASGDPATFVDTRQQLLGWIEQHGDDGVGWQAGLAVLRQNLHLLALATRTQHLAVVAAALDDARVAVSECAYRQASRALLQHQQNASRLGLMAAQLLSALDIAENAAILAQHLPNLGIAHLVAATYAGENDDPFAQSVVTITAGLPAPQIGRSFATRAFPPPGMFTSGEPLQLAVLPLVIDDQSTGFVAMSASNLELCAAIAHHLAAALRASRLYHAALAGRRQAEEASRMKSRFLATVGHELRTPLNLIVGLSDMMLREHSETLRPFGAALRDLNHIHASAQHLGRLIGDVLDLTSSEAGQLHLFREQLDLAEVLRGVAPLGEQMAREHGLEWRVDLPTHGPRVFGDRTRLRQVALNLISNAVKFTERGAVALVLALGDGQAVVSVSDTGMGVPNAERDQIFHEFHRAESAQRLGTSGLGLGLAVCRQLLALHGGTLGLRSPGDLGSGTTFFFALPVLKSSDELASPRAFAPEAREQAQGELVLVVDDDPRTLDLHCRMIERSGRATRRAENGRIALAAARQYAPRLILLDLMMPEMDGFATLDALQADPATRDIPVLILTAQSLGEAEIERCNRGVATLLNKGLFDSLETLERIERVLAHQRTLGGPTQRLVRRAMVFVHEHYAAPLRREQIAAHVGVSADYLADCFRQELGITPTSYLHRYRIHQARELLTGSDLSIAAVALAVGFSESAHFTRTFHREVGISPRAYRRGIAPAQH